jgi:hypothetical protein
MRAWLYLLVLVPAVGFTPFGCSSNHAAGGDAASLQTLDATASQAPGAAGSTPSATSAVALLATLGSGSGSCLPPCLTRLLGNCLPTGSCTLQADPAPDGAPPSMISICYDNGVREVVTLGEPGRISATVSRAGTACFAYEYEYDSTQASSSASLTYRDPQGAVAATARVDMDDAGMMQVAVACDGMTYSVNLNDPACPGDADGSPISCTTGVCP